MNKTFEKIKNCAFVKTANDLLGSKYFPFVTAALSVLCYYLGWDIVFIYYICITGAFIALFSDDVTPIISLLLFINVIVSLKNTPSVTMGSSDYYFRTEILVQTGILLTAFIASAVFRLAATAAQKKFKPTPVFFGLCAFAAVLFLNGIFSRDYTPKNLIYGAIMAACFLGIFAAMKDNLKMNSEGYEKIAYSFLAFSFLLVVELLIAYATCEGLFEGGKINRGKLIFGWGVYNTMGMLLVLCIPSIIFLAGKKKYGFVYTLYSFFMFVALFLSCSRQAMVCGVFIYPFCILALLLKGKNRLANIIILSTATLAGIILLGVFHTEVASFFKEIFDNLIVDGKLNGSGRMRIWREAIAHFRSAPWFGAGFFVYFSYEGNSGLGFIPLMCHNTILQVLSCCGIIGFAIYVLHRVQTCISFFKNVTVERSFIAVTILALLIMSLLDNHLFNLFPTLIYAALTAVLVKGEEKNNKLSPCAS